MTVDALQKPFISEVFGVAGHLTRFFQKGERDWESFERWRALHCRTNGLSTDVLNAYIRATHRRPAFGTVQGFLGAYSEQQRRQVLDCLKRDGMYVFPKLAPRQVVELLQEYAFAHESEAYPALSDRPEKAIFDANDPISPTCWHPQAALLSNEMIQDTFSDPVLVSIVGDYLRVVPRLTILGLWHSSHKFDEPNGQGAQMYHFDLGQPGWLNFFLYLSDVTPESGPHAYVKGSHRRDREGAHLRARGIQRIPDEDIERAYGKERIAEICGPAGTMFLADTRGFHKGVKPRTADRLIFQSSYANSDYTHPIEKIPVPIRSSVLADVLSVYPELLERFLPVDAHRYEYEREPALSGPPMRM